MPTSCEPPLYIDFILAKSHAAPDGMKRVLLVEDDPSTRWLVRNALKNECDFMTASTGDQAIEIYLKHMPEVVFLDFNLPGRRGDEVLRMILEQDPGAFVVVMSGAENLDAVRGMMNMGAKGMIMKPYGKDEIMRYLVNSAVLR